MVAALLRSPRRMQSAGWLGRTKARPYVAIRCAGVSNSGSVPGGVSNGGIAALAVWGGTKKRDTSPTFTASRLRLASSRDIET